MKIENIQVEVLPKATLPSYNKESSSFNLRVHSFKRMFKGNEELDFNNNLKYSISKGMIKMRPFERVLIGTGLIFSIPEGIELRISTKASTVLSQSIIPITSGIGNTYKKELDILIYNASQFLCDVPINLIIAEGVFMPVTKPEFILKP